MALTTAVDADVLALHRDIAFGGLRTGAGPKHNRVAIVIDTVGGQDLAAIANA